MGWKKHCEQVSGTYDDVTTEYKQNNVSKVDGKSAESGFKLKYWNFKSGFKLKH